jgi:hypothetical protein
MWNFRVRAFALQQGESEEVRNYWFIIQVAGHLNFVCSHSSIVNLIVVINVFDISVAVIISEGSGTVG